MQLWTEPKIQLVGRWVFEDHPDYQVPKDGDNLTRGLAFAAKGCYKSFGEYGRPCRENQRALLEHGHGSVLEHASFTFYIEGISRNLTLEMNRHRHFGISQESTRYVDETNSGFVLEPYYAAIHKRVTEEGGASRKELDFLNEHIQYLRTALKRYEVEVEFLMSENPLGLEGFKLKKWARGKARNALPGSLESKVTYTGNIRAWRHFLEARSGFGAEPEIRRLAYMLYKKLRDLAPLYVEDYSLKYPENKNPKVPVYPELVTPYKKV